MNIFDKIKNILQLKNDINDVQKKEEKRIIFNEVDKNNLVEGNGSIKTFVEEKEDPMLAKENLLAQVRYLEQRIQQEREEMFNKLKLYEDDKVSLEMKLSSLEHKINSNRANYTKELDNIKAQVTNELQKLSETYNEEISLWQKKLDEKHSEIEQLRNKIVFEEAQHKMLAEQKQQEYKQEIQVMQNKIDTLSKQFEEEKNSFNKRISEKEEEIVKLKSLLQLKEQQLKLEEEKFLLSAKDINEKRVQQITEMQQKFNQKIEHYKNLYKAKEEEFLTVKYILEQKYSEWEQQQQEIVQNLLKTRQNYEEKIKQLQDNISILSLKEEIFSAIVDVIRFSLLNSTSFNNKNSCSNLIFASIFVNNSLIRILYSLSFCLSVCITFSDSSFSCCFCLIIFCFSFSCEETKSSNTFFN